MRRSPPDSIKRAPAYSLSQAARYIGANQSTMGAWFRGKNPVLPTEAGPRELISFIDLVVAHLVLTIRKGYKIPMSKIRAAAEYLAEEGGDLTVIARSDFKHDRNHLFLTIDERLISLTERGQSVNLEIIKQGLEQLDYGQDGFAEQFFPAPNGVQQRDFAVSPFMNFGRLYIVRLGVGAEAIADRFFAGEDRKTLAADYDATLEEIDEAIRWHGRIAA